MRNRAKQVKETNTARPEREKVSREEALKRVKDLPKREERLIAAIRKVRVLSHPG